MMASKNVGLIRSQTLPVHFVERQDVHQGKPVRTVQPMYLVDLLNGIKTPISPRLKLQADY